MSEECRSVYFDPSLKVEAYQFQGVMQKFPNHFHEYYVIGFIEKGQRYLLCKNQEYLINEGDLLIFNPHDTHSCEQLNEKALDYRCLNISTDTMRDINYEITGNKVLPQFSRQVIQQSDLIPSLKELHNLIMQQDTNLHKEELFYFLLGQLIEEYGSNIMLENEKAVDEIQKVCAFIEENYAQNISLHDLSVIAKWDKYYLLRAFTRQKGISPYAYLEAIRIGKAKKLLEHGVLPVEVALQTGFADQSHFSNFFKKFIGLTPKQYMKIFMYKKSVNS